MTRCILAILADRSGARASLEAAFEASQGLDGSLIEALHVYIDPRSTILPTEEILTDDRRQALDRAETQERADLKRTFATVAGELGREHFAWRDSYGREGPNVLAQAKRADLLVIAVPPRHYAGDAQEALHAALLESHRPLLIVPVGYRRRPIRRIVVAWNEDQPCRLAVGAAEPWLRKVESVDVLHLDAGRPDGLGEAQALFAQMGLQASFRSVPWDETTPGHRLLAETVGADWLVMGAYRRGRFLDWLFGGVTADVLEGTTLPVFMLH